MPTANPATCPLCGFDDCEQLSVEESPSKPETPAVAGKPISRAAAVDAAKALLADSEAPLICGLNCLESESQFAAWKLADRLRATVDTTLTNRNRAAIQTFQRYGKVTATYGEIRNRSDLLLLWDCDLEAQSPCLWTLINDRKIDRKIVFVGSSSSQAAKEADFVFDVSSSKERNGFISLCYLIRANLAGAAVDKDLADAAGLEASDADKLYEILTSCEYGSLFFKQHCAESEFDLETESLMLMVRELNSKTRFVGTKLRDDLNALGAETVLTLASGFPQATTLFREAPRHAGLSYSAESTLSNLGADVVLMFGDADLHNLSPQILRGLKQAKVIQFARRPADFADVFVPLKTLSRGGRVSGAVFRGDGAMLQSCSEESVSELVATLMTMAE
jgi:formylmethanofuran dehydrogenase subunit B